MGSSDPVYPIMGMNPSCSFIDHVTLLHCCPMEKTPARPTRNFASDNNAGVHPEILEAIARANQGHVVAYGDDPYTRSAIRKFEEHFGPDIAVFFTFNGTGANVLSLESLTRSFHSVLCSAYAHIYTEALARFAHEHEMFLHVDGARIANAAAALGQTLRQATRDLGVDVLSFGGTKNGIMGGEAVVFFHPEQAQDFLYLRKQSMQLASKMRFIAAQFEALLTNDLWRRSAEHANRMARLLEKEISRIPGVKVVWKVEANGVFAQIPRHSVEKIKEQYFFYTWMEEESIVRWMCSFDTTEDDIRKFAAVVAEAVKE